MTWLSQNWYFVLFALMFAGMHLGHGGHGGHAGHSANENETRGGPADETVGGAQQRDVADRPVGHHP